MEQRVRSDYQIKPTSVTEEAFHTSCADTAWHFNANQRPSLNGVSKVMSDYVVPRFHARRAAGEKFFNNMYSEEVTVSTVGNGYQIQSVAGSCGAQPSWRAMYRCAGPIVASLTPVVLVNGHGHELPLISTALSDADIIRAQRRVSTEVLSKRGTGDSELWESLATYRQTMELLRNPLRQLQDLSKRLLNNAERGVSSRGLLKEVSSGYLIWRYGIGPLMKDIRDILSSLQKEGGDKEVTVRAKDQLQAESLISGSTTLGILQGNWQNQVLDAVTVRGMSLDRGHVSFANNLGLSFKGLAMLPLQLTSYSFVADWFTNLSSYVGATIPALGWTQLGSCLVTSRVTANTYVLASVTNLQPGSYQVTETPQGSVTIVQRSTTRTPLFPVSFERQSDFKFDSFKRAADGAALIASRFVKLNNLIGYTPNNSAFRDKKAYRAWAETLNASREFT